MANLTKQFHLGALPPAVHTLDVSGPLFGKSALSGSNCAVEGENKCRTPPLSHFLLLLVCFQLKNKIKSHPDPNPLPSFEAHENRFKGLWFNVGD